MKKKLILVTKALWVGGIETALVNLLRYFDYDTFDVTLLVLKAELNMLPQIDPRCTVLIADREQTVSFSRPYHYSRLFHLTEPAVSMSRLHRLFRWTIPSLRWIENRLYLRYIRSLMKGMSFDTAVIYSDVAAETAVRCIQADRFVMFYHHGTMRHVYHDGIAWRRADRIIAVSENQAAMLRDFEPRFARKIIAIHNMVDIEGVRAKGNLPLESSRDPKCFHIVSVGRIAWEKGQDLAVKACAALRRAGRTEVRWQLVGDGPNYAEVEEQIRQAGLENIVILEGMRENPFPYISQADLFVQPSRFESYGMTILEALILGTPVVSTDTPGAREILGESKAGILCGISGEDLACQICSLLDSPEQLETMRNAAEHTDFSAHNKAVMEALRRIL